MAELKLEKKEEDKYEYALIPIIYIEQLYLFQHMHLFRICTMNNLARYL